MDQSNRINPTSLTTTVARQTPKMEFGAVLARGLSTAADVSGALISGVTRGSPVASAAVAGMSAVSQLANSVTGVLPIGGGPSVRATAAPREVNGDMWALLEAQGMQSKEYLTLQNEMQRESREFNSISNILKVRHDSAKSAINNIR